MFPWPETTGAVEVYTTEDLLSWADRTVRLKKKQIINFSAGWARHDVTLDIQRKNYLFWRRQTLGDCPFLGRYFAWESQR